MHCKNSVGNFRQTNQPSALAEGARRSDRSQMQMLGLSWLLWGTVGQTFKHSLVHDRPESLF